MAIPLPTPPPDAPRDAGSAAPPPDAPGAHIDDMNSPAVTATLSDTTRDKVVQLSADRFGVVATSELLGYAASLATRTDVAGLRVEFKADLSDLRAEIKADLAEFRAEFKADLAELRVEFKADLAELRAEFKDDLASLRSEMKDAMRNQAIAIISATAALQLATVGVVASLVR